MRASAVRGVLAAVAAALALSTLAAPPAAAATEARGPGYSKLWGKVGEQWDPSGRLFDFSFAGYRQGNAKLPSPPATISVFDERFSNCAASATEVFKRALAWAGRQAVVPGEYMVLTVPAGTHTITERLTISRSWLVLRGEAGSAETTLYFPKHLLEVDGPNPEDAKGFYVNRGGFLTVEGRKGPGEDIGYVSGPHKRGSYKLKVTSTAGVRVGQYVQTWWQDVGGKFNDYMLGNLWEAPPKYDGTARVLFTAKVLAIRGNTLTLERRLPYDIRPGMVQVHHMPDTVTEVGVEGLTFEFKWSLYPGHHLERGYNALWLYRVRDCWARDITTIHADSSVLTQESESLTVTGLSIEARRTRANDIPNEYNERADADGHWGVGATHTFDLLVDGFETHCRVLHDVGTNSGGKWIVFANGKMKDGNLDLHRALAGPTLYTNIDVGLGSNALYSGGPPASGPNALWGTTWWNIRSDVPIKAPWSVDPPGDCSFGPSINLVNVNLIPTTLCKTWLYERSVRAPANLYQAQKDARRRQPVLRKTLRAGAVVSPV